MRNANSTPLNIAIPDYYECHQHAKRRAEERTSKDLAYFIDRIIKKDFDRVWQCGRRAWIEFKVTPSEYVYGLIDMDRGQFVTFYTHYQFFFGCKVARGYGATSPLVKNDD